jgi:hypothetical protein
MWNSHCLHDVFSLMQDCSLPVEVVVAALGNVELIENVCAVVVSVNVEMAEVE